jgi:DNA-binding LacI/PurR family transcriptional regulator
MSTTSQRGHADDAAIGALHALQNRSIHVPDEVSIVGFDGVEMSQAVWPQLTTNQVHRELMGQRRCSS